MSDVATTHIAKASLTVNAGPDQVWRALTDPDLVKDYFFGTTVTSDWQVGSPVTYTGEWDGQPYEDRGVVVEADPPLLLITTFFSPASGKADVPENHQRVTYRIQPIDGGCRVSVEQDNNDSEEAAERSSSSWMTILEGLATVAPSA